MAGLASGKWASTFLMPPSPNDDWDFQFTVDVLFALVNLQQFRKHACSCPAQTNQRQIQFL